METAYAYLRILRPVNCLMMGFAVLVGGILAGGFSFVTNSFTRMILGFLTGFLLTASSMILNDYADREIDAINEPNRPIPSGAISAKSALIYGLSLMILGLSLASVIGLASFLVAAAAWLLFLAYTLVGKRTGLPGNVLVSACVAVPFLYGDIISSDFIGLRVAVFALIAFVTNLGREITKGIVDIEGDEARGVKTVAVQFGSNTAAILASLFFLFAVGFSVLPALWEMVSTIYYVPPVLVTDFGLVFTVLSLLRNPSRDGARSQKRFVLMWMLVGLVAFLAGSA